jgi:hypothetical protein
MLSETFQNVKYPKQSKSGLTIKDLNSPSRGDHYLTFELTPTQVEVSNIKAPAEHIEYVIKRIVTLKNLNVESYKNIISELETSIKDIQAYYNNNKNKIDKTKVIKSIKFLELVKEYIGNKIINSHINRINVTLKKFFIGKKNPDQLHVNLITFIESQSKKFFPEGSNCQLNSSSNEAANNRKKYLNWLSVGSAFVAIALAANVYTRSGMYENTHNHFNLIDQGNKQEQINITTEQESVEQAKPELKSEILSVRRKDNQTYVMLNNHPNVKQALDVLARLSHLPKGLDGTRNAESQKTFYEMLQKEQVLKRTVYPKSGEILITFNLEAYNQLLVRYEQYQNYRNRQPYSLKI